eukprot:13717983-Alexandrium_andersonii.AAC.1
MCIRDSVDQQGLKCPATRPNARAGRRVARSESKKSQSFKGWRGGERRTQFPLPRTDCGRSGCPRPPCCDRPTGLRSYPYQSVLCIPTQA